MTWTVLDLAVVGVFIFQLVGWFCVLLALLRIKKGPVQAATMRGVQLWGRVNRIAETAQRSSGQLARAGQQLLTRLTRLRKRLDVTTPPAGLWVQPQHLRRALELATLVRSGGQKTTAGKNVKRRNVTLAQRLGLLPPIVTRLAPLGGIVRVALQTLRQLRR